MHRHASSSDRLARFALSALAALNLLFAVVFLAALFLATQQVRAAEGACGGQNLIAELRRDEPETLRRIEAEAAAVPNGDGLLWKVEKDGAPPSWLFGTMHLTDPRVVALTPAAAQAFAEATTVVIETTDVLDEARLMAVFAEHPELTMFTDGRSLGDLLTPEELETVRAGFAARGIPFASIRLMKPWMLSAMLALPACELARQEAGEPVLDRLLAEEARAAGKAVAGLESVEDQFRAMASLPMDFHVEGLVETIRLGARIDDVLETMVVLYEAGAPGMIFPVLRAVLPAAEANDADGYAAFEEIMITARNRIMAERAEPFLDEGGALIAVGALHLPGEEGLVALLAGRGYRVSPAE